jgi:beta-lactamase superfamily II metal-dependent hydrolase
VQAECLWPPAADDVPTIMTTNDSSMVLRLTAHGRRILLCGDIEDYAQRRLIHEEDLRAEVLILPHHGAVTPYTGTFIEAVKPAWCIRSSGQRDAQTRSHLPVLLAGLRCLNTADHGDIVIRVTPTELTVHPSRSPHEFK